MWIRNNRDLDNFKEAINDCESSVWVVTSSGRKFDLKDAKGYYLGLATILDSAENEEPELFADSRSDVWRLIHYLNDRPALPQVS